MTPEKPEDGIDRRKFVDTDWRWIDFGDKPPQKPPAPEESDHAPADDADDAS